MENMPRGKIPAILRGGEGGKGGKRGDGKFSIYLETFLLIAVIICVKYFQLNNRIKYYISVYFIFIFYRKTIYLFHYICKVLIILLIY